MIRNLSLAFTTIFALGAPEMAQACSGDACSSVTAGSWSNGRVSITDKDTSGKISVKVCFKNTKICNPWGINPGANSVALPQSKPPLSDTSVEIIEATYSQKPTQADTYATLRLTNGTARDILFSFGDDIAKGATDASSDTTPKGNWTGKQKQRSDGSDRCAVSQCDQGGCINPIVLSLLGCQDLN